MRIGTYRRKSKGDKLFELCNYIFLISFSFAILYPFWDVFLLSFSDPLEASSLGMRLWIEKWSVSSYQYILSDSKVIFAYGNTIFITLLGTILTVAFTILAAYPLSKRELPFRNWITMAFIITMFFSGGLIPFYLLIRNIGMVDSRWALIIPSMLNVYNIIIMRNFLMTIDKAIEESAFLDGANHLIVLVKIIIPLSKPVIATIALWSAVYHWNDWFHALIFIRDEKKIVLQLLLRRMLELTQADSSSLEAFSELQHANIMASTVRAAITIVTIGPIVLLYPFLQKYFIKGIMVGSLKG